MSFLTSVNQVNLLYNGKELSYKRYNSYLPHWDSPEKVTFNLNKRADYFTRKIFGNSREWQLETWKLWWVIKKSHRRQREGQLLLGFRRKLEMAVMGNRWRNSGNSVRLFLGAPKSLQMVTAAMKLKDAYSLEGLMLKLKLQYFGHLMWRVDSLEKTHAGRDWGQEDKGTTEDEVAGWHHRLDGQEFG